MVHEVYEDIHLIVLFLIFKIFDNFILVEAGRVLLAKLFAKIIPRFPTYLLVGNCWCGKLVSSFAWSILFGDNISPVSVFVSNFNSCNFILALFYWVIFMLILHYI